MTTTPQNAYEFAIKRHGSQVDKAGKPYSVHLKYVSELSSSLHKNHPGMCATVGYLHDILEDTDCTAQELEEKFGAKVSNTVKLLTRDKNDSYMDYIDKIANSGNYEAMAVKIADLLHNLDLSRIGKNHSPTSQDVSRNQRYLKALTKLLKEYL